MTTSPAPRVLFAIFCDMVRQEAGDKLAFMGVYPLAMVVDDFPATVACFAVALSVDLQKPTDTVTLEIRVPGAAEPLKAENLVLKQKGPSNSATAILNMAPMVFPEPGDVVLTATFGNGGKHESKLRLIRRKELPTWDAPPG